MNLKPIGTFFKIYMMPLVVLALAGVVAHDHLTSGVKPSPLATVNGKALGRSYAPTVVANLGDAWLAAAHALEQGKTVTEAQQGFQQSWQAARVASFGTKIAPEFAKVLPEGQEPTDPTKRAAVVKLWRDFANGLKGGR